MYALNYVLINNSNCRADCEAPRKLPWTAGALATSAAIAAETQPHVIVEAGRPTTEVVSRTGTGVPIVLVELRGRVDYSDLDLSIDSNAKVFKQRVHDAARRLCADLDQLYPVTDSARNCTSQAEHGAMS